MSTEIIELSDKEHVLQRSDLYVGSKDSNLEDYMTLSGEHKYDIIKALIVLYDEILMNSLDNIERSINVYPKNIDKEESYIKIYLGSDLKTITVQNDGYTIPLDGKINITKVFTHMKTSSNYTGIETGAGRNGYGAKLVNIFSKTFKLTIESNGKKFEELFKNNTDIIEDVTFMETNETDSFTRVQYTLDFSEFGVKKYDKIYYDLFMYRAYELQMWINFKGYKTKIYAEKGNENENLIKYSYKNICDIVCDKYIEFSCKYPSSSIELEFSIGKLKEDHSNEEDIGYVNGVNTSSGKHLDYIYTCIQEYLKKKLKTQDITVPKNAYFIIVFLELDNPSFDSESKDKLKNNIIKDYKLNTNIIKEEQKNDFLAAIYKEYTTQKVNKKLKMSKKTYVEKLEDAPDVGKKDCTLIITEGDSASTLARAVVGMSEMASSHGILSLGGKIKNVIDSDKISDSKKLNDVLSAIGLEYNQEIPINKLRYQKIMLMTDEDDDGHHIKALVVSFLAGKWPYLLEHDFIRTFITPIVKVEHKKSGKIFEFFSEEHFEAFINKSDTSQLKIKYLKGLGSSNEQDAKRYSEEIKKYIKIYAIDDIEKLKTIMLNQMSKLNAEFRKENTKKIIKNIIDYSQEKLNLYDLFDIELEQYEKSSQKRSIPSVIDGLKISERKILFAALTKSKYKYSGNSEKVCKLASDVENYHHGEISLQNAIVKMAENSFTLNNLSLLFPDGEFGNRTDVSSAASSRYIFTKLEKYTSEIFKIDDLDEALIEYEYEDGKKTLPTTLVPLIPMVLVNGATGIASGWSTNIPMHDPITIIDSILNKIHNNILLKVEPKYIGCFHLIKEKDTGGFTCRGTYTIKNNKVLICELPPNNGTTNYAKSFEKPDSKGETNMKKYNIKKIINQSTGNRVLITVIYNEIPDEQTIIKELKLEENLGQNIVCFNTNDEICKYKDSLEVMTEFYDFRIKQYQKLKEFLINKYDCELFRLEQFKKFVENYHNIYNGKQKDVKEIETELLKFDIEQIDNSYQFLHKVTFEEVEKADIEKLIDNIKELEDKINKIKETKAEQMYETDLLSLKETLEDYIFDREKQAEIEVNTVLKQ